MKISADHQYQRNGAWRKTGASISAIIIIEHRRQNHDGAASYRAMWQRAARHRAWARRRSGVIACEWQHEESWQPGEEGGGILAIMRQNGIFRHPASQTLAAATSAVPPPPPRASALPPRLQRHEHHAAHLYKGASCCAAAAAGIMRLALPPRHWRCIA